MADFFHKKKGEENPPEDFVLFTPEDEQASGQSETIEDTNSIDINEVKEALVKQEKKELSKKKAKLGSVFANRRVYIFSASAILIAALFALLAFGFVYFSNSLYGYEQVAAAKSNITRDFEIDSTLESGNRYEITSLVAGKIIKSEYDVGEEVASGAVLYELDDTEAKLAVERAKNAVEKAKDPSSTTTTSSRIISTESGVIQTLKITAGSTVNAGSQIGTVKRADGDIVPVLSYVAGKVTVVSVKAGQSLSVGQLIAMVQPDNSKSESNTTYDKKDTEIDLQTAQRHLENYKIKSPVKGVIVEKNSKPGDNVGITNSDKPMMVIVDTSKLTFKFSVDEYRLRDMEKGQKAIVSVESIPETTFDGEITAIDPEGRLNEEGKTVFDITVTIDKPGDLKSGMNIHAKIILASQKNVLSVPQKALLESDGRKALVLVKNDEEEISGNDTQAGESLENQLAFPWIKVPKNCELLSVTYGLSNGDMVQIKSGLKAGDIVVYDPDAENVEFVSATANDKDKSIEISEPAIETDEELQQDLENEINKILQQSNNL